MPPICYRCGRLSVDFGLSCECCRSADTEDAPDLRPSDADFQKYAGWCAALCAALCVAIIFLISA